MKAITLLNGRRAMVKRQSDGRWSVVTSFLGMPMGTRFAPGKFGPEGPTWDLTEKDAQVKADEWDRFLAKQEDGDSSSDAKRRSAPSSIRRRSR